MVTSHAEVDQDGLARYLAPRGDVVIETEAEHQSRDGEHTYRYGLERGPFTHYRRAVTVTEVDSGAYSVTQHVDFRMGIGVWGVPIRGLLARTFRRPGGKTPWWAPPEVLDTQGAASLASLAYLALVAGYLGTLITQTITYVADEFDASSRVQGDTLAVIRIGIVVAMGIAAWADRHGRRRAMLACAAGGCAVTALGAVVPSMTALGATQVVARGLSTALALLIVVVVAEEMPAGSRAYGAALLAMAGGLGAGFVLWLLPVVDVDERAWRLIYVAPLLFLPLIAATRRMLPESRRFVRTHAVARFAGHGRRLALLATAALCLTILGTPASQLQNEFLRDEWSFSATRITFFTILTVTPASIGIVLGGRLADMHGKRLIGGIGLGAGAIFTAAQFIVDSQAVLWATATVGGIVGGLAVPALAVYGPELFPTALRAKANVVITTLGVAGSVIGLTVVGRLADRWSLGSAIAVMAIAPVLATIFVIPRYPETAHRELEDLNPEDALGTSPLGGPLSL